MNLSIRKATKDDMDLIYTWANDPVVRQNAFHTEQIPYENHIKWYQRVLQDKDVDLYIISENGENVGQVRFSTEEGVATIDYSVCKEMRGKGYGTAMIALAQQTLLATRDDVTCFLAQVKYENQASSKVFIKNGYQREEKEAFIEFRKEG